MPKKNRWNLNIKENIETEHPHSEFWKRTGILQYGIFTQSGDISSSVCIRDNPQRTET